MALWALLSSVGPANGHSGVRSVEIGPEEQEDKSVWLGVPRRSATDKAGRPRPGEVK